MDKYLKEDLPKLNPNLGDKDVTLVIGNESGDLDSCVSSVIYAFHLFADKKVKAVPVFNFPKSDLDLKTEVTHCFKSKLGLELDNVLCADQIDGGKSYANVILVDHNRLENPQFLSKWKIAEVIDHHEICDEGILPENRLIERSGSCSTLVLRKILSDSPGFRDESALNLIRWTILIDTVNLDPERKKVTPADVRILETAENLLSTNPNPEMKSRLEVFREISQVKFNVEHFSLNQLLRKDKKIVTDGKSVKISISSIPKYSCSELFLRFKDEFAALKNEAAMDCYILLGRGDLFVGSENPDLRLKIKRGFEENQSEVHLIHEQSVQQFRGDLYSRKSQTVTRKQILPCVQKIIMS